MEEKKEGVSYSDSKKNKTALEVLGLEFLILKSEGREKKKP